MARPNDSSRRDLPDIQWLERMYNNRQRVPDHGDYFARWAAESALVRRSLPCQLDVRYGDGAGETLDAFAAERPRSPIVVFIHGGYWKAMDKSQHSFVVPALRDLGAAVVVPNYALAPKVGIPDITLQMVRAVAWSWRHARTLGGDARRIVVMGHSAGGQLAAMMLACAWNRFEPALPPRLVRAALGISGLYDLQPLLHTPSLQEVLRLTPRQVQAASPDSAASAGPNRPRRRQVVVVEVVAGVVHHAGVAGKRGVGLPRRCRSAGSCPAPVPA
jgi:arylformamidase